MHSTDRAQGAHPPANTAETLDALFEEGPDDNADEDLLLARVHGLLRHTKSVPDIEKARTRPKWVAAAAAAAAGGAGAAPTPIGAKGARKSSGARDGTRDKHLAGGGRRRTHPRKRGVTLEALSIADASDVSVGRPDDGLEWTKLLEMPVLVDAYDDRLLESSQQEFL